MDPRSPKPRVLVLIGVSGSGKTTIGRLLAEKLGWAFFEADDFHSAENKAKMARLIPLTDADRAPWLRSMRAKIEEVLGSDGHAVFTCSALKERYRVFLADGIPGIELVHLRGDYQTIYTRVANRQGHFMKADMVKSQFEALEPPTQVFTVDVDRAPEPIAEEIRAHFAL